MKRLLAAALALLLLCGCTLFAPADQAPEDTRPQEDGADSSIHLDTSRTEALFTLGYSPDLSLNPYLSRSTVNWTFLPLLYEGLFQLTPGFARGFDCFQRCFEFLGIHETGPPYFSISRLL